GPGLAVEDLFVQQPGDALHHQDQRQEREDPGGDADDGAFGDLARLLGDLGLGELNLLADEAGDPFGDVEDELAEFALVFGPLGGRHRGRGRWRWWRLLRHQFSLV